ARELPVFGRTPMPDWEATLLGLMISEGQCHTPGHSPVFTSGDQVLVSLLEEAVAAGGLGVVTFNGIYGYRIVNRAGRGGIAETNRCARWLSAHGLNVRAAEKFVPQVVFKAPRETVRLFLQALFSGDGGAYYTKGKYLIEY